MKPDTVKLLDPASEAVEGPKEHSLLPGGLFTNPITKKPWNDDTAIMRHWQSVLKKSRSGTGIPYQTRHNYASLLLSAGESYVGGVPDGACGLGNDKEAIWTMDPFSGSFRG